MALAFTFGAAVIGGLGWFLLAWLVVKEPAGDAAGEALGVAFGVLIVVSVVGAFRGFARSNARESTDRTDSTVSAEDPETRS